MKTSNFKKALFVELMNENKLLVLSHENMVRM